jgi:hypothetical protein
MSTMCAESSKPNPTDAIFERGNTATRLITLLNVGSVLIPQGGITT